MKGLVLGSDIALANRMTRMSVVLEALGMEDPAYAASGAKVFCPFERVYHPDGQRSFRVYDDSTAYCYACSERYTSVQLYARAKDISLDESAAQLLELIGYKKPTAEERFAAAQAAPYKVDQDALASALKTYCARIDPDWEFKSLDNHIASKLRQCLNLLSYITTHEDAKTWLATTKAAMAKVLGAST